MLESVSEKEKIKVNSNRITQIKFNEIDKNIHKAEV